MVNYAIMVAHNKNFVPVPKPSTSRNPRYGEPKDAVSPLHESDLICELADPSNSLEDICAAQGISLEALSLWMARPDVAERLDLVQTTAMNRARFIGRLTLPTAAQSAANIINAHKLRPQKPTIDSAFGSDLHRANETMLKAARFLQRLTLEPDTRRARKSGAPSSKEVAHQAIEEASNGHGKTSTETKATVNGAGTPQASIEPSSKHSSGERSRKPTRSLSRVNASSAPITPASARPRPQNTAPPEARVPANAAGPPARTDTTSRRRTSTSTAPLARAPRPRRAQHPVELLASRDNR